MGQSVSAGTLDIKFIADLMRLQTDLDKAKKMVGGATDQIARSARAANDNLGAMGSGIGKAGTQSKLAGHHVQNLAFQFQDLGIQMAAAAGSSAPIKGALMALMQQGAQINGIMSQAGIGVRGLIAAAAGMAAPFLPVIAVVGTLAAGIGLITSQINENSKVHVTWGDTALGAWDAFAAYIKGGATSALEFFGIKTADVWKTVVEGAKWGANRVIGLMTLVPRMMLDSWRLIPAAAADIFFSVTNASVDAVNAMIRSSISGVNGLIAQANRILPTALNIPTIGPVEIARHSGAAAKLAKSVGKSFQDTLTRDFVGDIANTISPFAQARAVERMKKDAKKAGKDTGTAAAKAVKEAVEKEKVDLVKALEADQLREFYKKFMADQEKAWDDFNQRVANTANDVLQQRLDADAAAAAKLNEELDKAVGLLGSMGKFGGALGGLLNAYRNRAENPTVLDSASLGQQAAFSVFGRNGSGGALGSAIGGALGEKLGAKFLSKGFETISKGLGSIAGPIGTMLGGLAGSILGGMFSSTKWGRTDLTSAGASAAIGNSGKSEQAALSVGKGIYGVLNDLVQQFGGTLGEFGSIAVGVRDGKYRVNTGGTSLKVKKGAKDFGDDAEAAAFYAIQEAINRGAVRGVRAATSTLLKSSDDLQANIEKALRFESVFTDLKAATDPVGASLDAINKQFDQLKVIFGEAGASAEEYAQLEQLLSLRRQEALRAESDALEDIRSRIAEVQGDDATVRMIERQRELKDAMSDTVRSELERLYAIEDATRAQQEATAAQEASAAAAEQLAQAQREAAEAAAQAAAEIEKQRINLRIDILEEQGRAEEALTLRRQQLRAETDALLQTELEELFAAQDATKAQQAATKAAQAAAQAQQELADAQKAAAEAAEAESTRLANSLLDLRSRLAEAQGDDALVQQIARTRELDGAQTDLERSLIRHIHAAQTAAQAQADLEAAQEKAAAAADRLSSLQIRLFNAQGNTAAAQALEQQLELAGAQSDAERAILRQIYAAQKAAEEAEKAQAAADAQAQAQADARKALADSYRDEADALQQTADKFRQFADTIREFREGLFTVENGMLGFDQLRSQFQNTAAMAKLGNEASLERFVGDAQAYLEAARNQAGSLTDYQRIVGQVAAASRAAELGAGGIASEAQAQIKLLEEQIGALEAIGVRTEGVALAVAALEKSQIDDAVPALSNSFDSSIDKLSDRMDQANARAERAEAMLQSTLQQLAVTNSRIESKLTRWDRGDAMATKHDDPVDVDVKGIVQTQAVTA